MIVNDNSMPAAAMMAAAQAAARAVPPAWPLAASVAVNPFLGQADETLQIVAARLARVAGVAVTMPRAWYRARIADGTITDVDLAAVLEASRDALRPSSIDALKNAVAKDVPVPRALPMVADLATDASGTDWRGLIAERFGAWAAGYFDDGQALWLPARATGAYASWRSFATHDLTPEIMGLSGFAQRVADGADDAAAQIVASAQRLGVPSAAAASYFHQLLLDLGGWSHYARFQQWQAELAGGADATLLDLLAIRLFWEEALFAQRAESLAARWQATLAAHAAPLMASADHVVDALLQAAAERAAQRGLVAALAAPRPAPESSRPAVQAVFCIDVRAEVFRRALESLDPRIETLGFAGFFGLSVRHRRFASNVGEARCPVLLTPGVTTSAGDGGAASSAREADSRVLARARRAWGRFQLAAVSSFAFVEAMGPVYAGKLVRDALGLVSNAACGDPAPRLDPALDLAARVDAAEAILKAMSLARGPLAPLVVLVGHGASVVNNPHASALHCGACGGYSGEVNARLVAALLNEAPIREGLAARGVAIPADTLFVGALHDTTSDAVTLYDGDIVSPGHAPELARLRDWLMAAGRLARGERALRLPRASGETSLARRGHDWAEIRPEWGLAGCNAFIAAPRQRTVGRNLEGRAFLHSYAWRDDLGFGVLELIMTAPVVVASWISLQYYGSTVAPGLFGAGNKLLHNVSGGIGVFEGNGGKLRVGLPWQSVHDGERIMHEPLRLTVMIEAPVSAMTDVLARHAGVRALFDNGWLHLLALDDAGRVAARYVGDLAWDRVTTESPAAVAGAA